MRRPTVVKGDDLVWAPQRSSTPAPRFHPHSEQLFVSPVHTGVRSRSDAAIFAAVSSVPFGTHGGPRAYAQSSGRGV